MDDFYYVKLLSDEDLLYKINFHFYLAIFFFLVTILIILLAWWILPRNKITGMNKFYKKSNTSFDFIPGYEIDRKNGYIITRVLITFSAFLSVAIFGGHCAQYFIASSERNNRKKDL